VANNIIANFRARVLSYPNSIFEAGPCLDATLEELNAVGLLDDASLIVTPNAYNEGVLYDVIPNTPLGDMDVVRATTATRVNSSGLIEVVPRNLITYSNDFTNAAWIKTSGASITANSVIAPNGTMTADTLNVAVATYSGIYQNLGSLSGQNTISIYAKKGTKDFLYFINLQGSTTAVWFNISNGTLGTVSSGYTATITDVGNSWYRCTLSQSVSATSYFQLGLSDSDGSVTPTSTGTAYIWGAQLEAFSTATEYFPTTTRLNIPRIDYTNGSCPSLLVEPQRTNLYFPSIPSSSGGGTYTLNDAISPDGTQNASSFVPSGFGVVYSNSISTTVQTYTFSVYLKGTVNGQKVGLGDNGNILNNFTITTSWQRYTFTFTGSVQNTPFYLLSGNYFSPAENNKFYIYGAQLEVGSYATSLIPTQASSVTRNADVISKTGISSLIDSQQGVLFMNIKALSDNYDSQSSFIGLTSGTFADTIQLYYTSTRLGGLFRSNFNSSDVFVISSTINTFNKVALRWVGTTFSVFANGVLIGTRTLTQLPINKLNTFITNDGNGGSPFSGNIDSIQIYKTPLTDEQLTLLTGDLYDSYSEMANSLNYILE
jgi:hypothetical protein